MFGTQTDVPALHGQIRSLQKKLRDQEARLEDRARRLRRVGELEQALNDAKIEVHQLTGVVKKLAVRIGACLPMPPESLRLHVGTRASDANFWSQGINSSRAVLEVFGHSPTGPILDWGCGSGRTLHWLWAYPAWRECYHGCDVDAEAIAWLASQGMAHVAVCSDCAALPYANAHFHGLFAFSVLTHIHPEQHRAWYAELHRVLRPGGIAYLTTHGESIVNDPAFQIPDANREEFRASGFTYVTHEGHYKDAALASERHTRRMLEGLFTIENYRPRGYQNLDAFLVRRIG